MSLTFNAMIFFSRVANAGNFFLVNHLLSEFNADYSVIDPGSNDNLLHISLRKKAVERYRFVLHFPSLLHQRNSKGDLPLFIACRLKDIEFLQWLYKNCPGTSPDLSTSSSSAESTTQFPSTTDPDTLVNERSLDKMSINSNDDIPPSPKVSEIVKMKPLAADNAGYSVFHILAASDSAEILTIMLNLSSVSGLSFAALHSRVTPQFSLPVEIALRMMNMVSARALLELSLRSGELHQLGNDKHILKVAVVTKNIESVRLLVEYGIHKGIDFAISIASTYKIPAILRLLLFWYTEILCYNKMQKVSKSKTYTFVWKQIDLNHISSVLLFDGVMAVNTTMRCISEYDDYASLKHWSFLQLLGRQCLEYFVNSTNFLKDGMSFIEAIKDEAYIKITTLDLSENHLTEVPSELFQLPSMDKVLLKNNMLTSLPSSEDHSVQLYRSPIRTLILDFNQLTSIPDDLVWGLASTLKTLSVQSNELANISPGIWFLKNLNKLKLSANNLSQLHYFSDSKSFNSCTFVKNVTSFEVDKGGNLQLKGNISLEGGVDICKMTTAIKQLASLQHTLLAIKSPANTYENSRLFTLVLQIYNEKLTSKTSRDEPIYTPTSGPMLQNPFQFLLHEREGMREFYSGITELYLAKNNFSVVPWDLPCLTPGLEKVYLGDNAISVVDMVHEMPCTITHAYLSNNSITELCTKKPLYPCGHPVRLISVTSDNCSTEYCKHRCQTILSFLNTLYLDNNQLNYFRVARRPLVRSLEEDPDHTTLDRDVPLYPNLVILSIKLNHFIEVPRQLHLMKHLNRLDISYNDISRFPSDLGRLDIDKICVIEHAGVVPHNIPESIFKAEIPAKAIVNYLRHIELR